MRNLITNEFEDKKVLKNIVRYALSLYKGWGNVLPCNIVTDI